MLAKHKENQMSIAYVINKMFNFCKPQKKKSLNFEFL